MVSGSARGRRVRLSLALGGSALAWGLAWPSAAQAQCAPDPTVANGTTTCTGTDANGIRVTTPGTTLTVSASASVSNTGAPAIAVDVPKGPYPTDQIDTINVFGRVTGAGQNGITAYSGTITGGYDYSGQQIVLTIGSGGAVSGTTALSLVPSANNRQSVTATIDNAGTLIGTSGTALVGNATTNGSGYTIAVAGFSSLTNRLGASIAGGILGPVISLANAGVIDGGAISAIDSSAGSAPVPYYSGASSNWSNGGTIRSTSNTATLLIGIGPSQTITNSGTITNTGSGAAVNAAVPTSIQNAAGGSIISGGATAITANATLTLVNAGSITGDVTLSGASSIDSTRGTINGSVTFGAGDDMLMASYAGNRTLATGITGAINGGGGANTEQVTFAAATAIATPLDLAPGFNQLGLAPASGITVTLQQGFASTASVVASGTGTIVNRGTIAVAGGSAFLAGTTGSMVRISNEGTISMSGATAPYAVSLRSLVVDSFTNSGSISSSGGGVTASAVTNTGSITAAGTGVELLNGGFDNRGSIASTGGTGVLIGAAGSGSTITNAGMIRGAVIGVETGVALTNTGTINSSGTGVVVDALGYLVNAAGGTVNGGSGGAVSVMSFSDGVVNAGTINGNVALHSTRADDGMLYVASSGGVLNGNLSLGTGGTLVTDLVNSGPGLFAGITGAVTAGNAATLRYNVASDATATLGAVGPFASAGYQLANGATLTLATPAGTTQGRTVLLAGTGAVDLTGTVSVVGAPAIQSTSLITYPGSSVGSTGLAITSHGSLSGTSTDSSNFSAGVVALQSADSFINAGSIALTYRGSFPNAAVNGGTNVTNSGQITLDGATGISGATTVTNTGTISQVPGGGTSAGVTGVSSLTNGGTINVGGVAVQLGSYYSGSGISTITNTGTLASTGGAAITLSAYNFGYSTQITNAAGGTIAGVGNAIQVNGVTLTNAGTITGTADLGYAPPYYAGASTRSYNSSTYVAAGGTVAGNLLFGSGGDLLLQTGDTLGISGTIDGGDGTDIYGRVLSASGTVAIDPAGLRNFEDALVQANGTGTTVTTTATGTFAGNLYAIGNGSVVNGATIAGTLTTTLPYTLSTPRSPNPLFPSDQVLASLANTGSVAGGITGTTASFTNSGTVTSSLPYTAAVGLYGGSGLAFTNSGTIAPATPAAVGATGVSLTSGGSVTITNSGRIDGGLAADLDGNRYESLDPATSGVPVSLAVTNSGTINSGNGAVAAEFSLAEYGQGGGELIHIGNSGTISAQGSAAGGGTALELDVRNASAQPIGYAITNSGTISATGSGTSQAAALIVNGDAGLTGTITNAAGGTISATGNRAFAVAAADSPLTLVNAGTITAAGTRSSVAVATFDAFNNTVRNTGTITGDVVLADGADTVDNAGTINGAVFLGAGDDRFVQHVGGSVTGTVDGGDGTDAFVLDTTGGTAPLTAPQIANFETVTQTGTGTGRYQGNFGVGTIALAGGTLQVATGQTLATTGATTVTGTTGSGNLTVNNAGTIAGGITLADGNDTVVNTGTIAGAVRLGDGDDTYVEGVGSRAGLVDGGAGTNLYRVVLAGDRSGIGARTNFQNLAVDGTGTLALTLDQSFGTIALAGTGLTLTQGSFTVGRITATGAASAVTLGGDVASVQLGAGNDTLAIGAATLAGRYDGGAGSDTLRLTNAGPVTLLGAATGFETVALTGNALTVSGMLGSAGQALAITGGDKTVTVARGGTLAGTIDLGAGNDGFRLAAGGTLAGTVSGGAGSNTATLDLSAGDLSLRAGSLTNFARLVTEGPGTLTLAGGGFAHDTVAVAGNLTVGADATLAASLAFGPGDNRLAVAGGFTGAVDGGGGNDSIDVSGGSAAAPVAFTTIANVEAFRMSGGLATVSGNAALGAVTLTGGRLIGLAGSRLSAGSFTVGAGATFGSAGTVTGNVAVAGTLSPGASPGTMTVNGNVSLAAGSVSLFEITPAVSDKLVVNGAVAIAGGATLQLVPTGTLAPGSSLDLITATRGITGRYTTIAKPASLFGFVVQDATSIRLLGQFLNDPSNSPQVGRGIDYLNGVLVSGQASAALLAAAPSLVTAGGTTNAAAVARLTPEPYAAARQIGVENGLTLADAARGDAFAAGHEGLFTFAAALTGTRTLEADAAAGTAQTTTNGFGFLGGVGIAGADWSLGAFGGWLKDRQNLSGLGARTTADGAVAGIHGRARYRGVGVKATLAYDGAQADTRRALPGGTATGRYDLHGWVADASIDMAVPLAAGWEARPSIGGTAIRTTRDGAAETGGSAFALAVAGRRDSAAFVDGGVTFAGTAGAGAGVRPYLSLGVRYQADGRVPYALAGLGGGGIGLLATGAARAPVLATATLGADVALSPRLALFGALSGESGDADHRAAARTGLRLAF